MMLILILLTASCFIKVNCDNNAVCCKKFSDEKQQNLAKIQKIFEDILEEYVNLDEILQQAINKLIEVDHKTSSELDNLQKNVKQLKNKILKLNETILSIYPQISSLKDEIKKLNFDDWLSDILSANKSANLFANTPTVPSIQQALKTWTNFTERFNQTRETMSILVTSIFDDLNWLESILDKEFQSIGEENCFESLKNELRSLYKEVLKLLKEEGIENFSEEIKQLTKETRELGEDIRKDSNNFSQEFDKGRQTQELAKDALKLAEDLEIVKKNIDDSVKNNLDELNKKFMTLVDSFDEKYKQLIKDYEVSDFIDIFKELEEVANKIEAEGNLIVNLEPISLEINSDSITIDCYHEFFKNCGRGVPLSIECQNTIDNLKKTLLNN